MTTAVAATGDKTEKPAAKPRGGDRDGLFIGRDNGPGPAHRPQVLRGGRRDRDRRRPGPDVAGGPGRAALALRDAQGSLRHPRLAGDHLGRRRSACPSRATRSTAPTTSRGSRSTTPTRATSSYRPRATSPAFTRASTTSAACTRRPANEIVRGALGLKYNVSKGEQDLLNPKGINAIRFMNDAIRIWGARTLSIGSVVALHQRPPPVHHGRDVDRARHPVGRVRAQRPSPLEARARGRSRRSSRCSGATARSWAPRPSRPSTSSATRRPTRPRSSTPASWSSRSASPR